MRKIFRCRACFATGVLCGLLWISQSVWGQNTPKKYALLIGLNDYLSILEGVQELKYAENDVDTLERILRSQGYEVTVLKNGSAERRRIIRELYKYAKKLRDNDWFVLFYAGHGVRNKLYNDEAYWLTYDAELPTLDVAGIRLRHLLDYVQDIKANRKLVLLDHCYSGDIIDPLALGGARGGGGGGPPRRVGVGDQPLADATDIRDAYGGITIERGAVPLNQIRRQLEDHGQGMVIIAAARNEALELHELRHGLFTHVLGEALTTRKADTDGDANLSIDELKNFLKNEIPRLATTIANFEQQIMESTVGVNLTGWIIANNLPLNSLAETAQKVQDYKSRLDIWSIRYGLTVPVKVECKNCLDRWLDSLREEIELSEKCQKIVDQVRGHMELSGLPEESIAKDLDETVQLLLANPN